MWSHHLTNVNGINLHYVTQGKGFPVVLLHGWPGFWYTWRKQIPALAEKFQIIALDMRGCGDSDKPTSGYDAHTIASDIHGVVQSLGHPKAALVATSVGVRMAYRYCLDYESEVDRVAIIDTSHPLTPAGAAMLEPLSTEQAKTRWHNLFHWVPDLPERLVEGHEEVYLRYFFHSWSGGRDFLTAEELAQYVKNYQKPGAMGGGFNLYRAAPSDVPQWRADADRKLLIPMLFIRAGGEHVAQGLHGNRPVDTWSKVFLNTRSTSIPDCGHFPNEEKPKETNQALLSFLGEVRS